MIASDKLRAGTCYFFVTYEDSDPGVPVVETLRFKNKAPESDARSQMFVFERVGDIGNRQRQLSEHLLTKVFELDDMVSELSARLGAHRAGTPYEPRYCDD